MLRRSNRNATGCKGRRGINRSAALWILCRHRHKGHWTGHKSRLDRLEEAGKREYAFEELIAELGACFTLSRLGVDTDAKNSAAYIGSWLKALADDKKFIFKAATAAQKATDFLFDLQEQDAKQQAA